MMNNSKIVISGTGCAVADFLYKDISFESSAFAPYVSHRTGDGGLLPGKLVFSEELEQFASKPYAEILKEIAGGRAPDAVNIGGPSIVALIHVAQLLDPDDFEVNFYGSAGNDDTADQLMTLLEQTPLDSSNYKKRGLLPTSFTDVFSDASYDNGHGERSFVHATGAASEFQPTDLPPSLFDADLVCFGGTALVPQIHDALSCLLRTVKERNNITLVNTVYDFRNERKHPGERWPLVDSDEDYKLIDILILDCEEALKISGHTTIEDAAQFFIERQVSSFVITNGSQSLWAYSDGRLFDALPLSSFPVSEEVIRRLSFQGESGGDTTGCGDNFVGGFMASVGMQLKNQTAETLDLLEAVSWAVASGGYACFYMGGTYYENEVGEKLKHVSALKQQYDEQLRVLKIRV